VLESGGRRDDMIEDVEKMSRSGGTTPRSGGTGDTVAMGESSGGST
jgi:hypothetical protein